METKVENNDQLVFMLGNCAVIIKHLLSISVDDTKSKAYKTNYNDLLRLPEISYWKKRIPMSIDVTTILGSKDSCFENSFAKLLTYGLNTSEILPKNLLEKYLSFLEKKKCENIYDSLARLVVANYLFASGLSNNIVDEIVTKRINCLFDFVTSSPIKFNIYSESTEIRIPSQYHSKKLVNPILYQKNELILPLVYDIFIFYHIYEKVSESLRIKIDTIIEYISDSRYQAFDYGYGLIKRSKNKFHSMGWSTHLPFYNDNLATNYFEKGLIYRMVLFSKFNNPVIQNWIEEMLIKLEKFKINSYQYCFPHQLLPETKNSYFMNGRHMGLGENRTKKLSRIIESTYYIYIIQKNRRGFEK